MACDDDDDTGMVIYLPFVYILPFTCAIYVSINYVCISTLYISPLACTIYVSINYVCISTLYISTHNGV